MLAEVDAPHFNCGIVFIDDVVIRTAPILYYMRGWDRERVREHCVKKGWRITQVEACRATSSAEPPKG